MKPTTIFHLSEARAMRTALKKNKKIQKKTTTFLRLDKLVTVIYFFCFVFIFVLAKLTPRPPVLNECLLRKVFN